MRFEELKQKKTKSGIVLLYIFLILPFLGIAGIRDMVGGLYSLWQAGSMYALLIIAFVKAKYANIDPFVGALAIYEIVMIAISTYYSGFSTGITVVSLTFILLTISAQFYWEEMLEALAIIACSCVLINLFSVVGRLIGANRLFFLGGKNQLSMFMIPGAACIIVHALQRRKNLNFFEVFVLGCIVFSIVAGASGAGIVCALLAITMFSSNKLVQNKKLLFAILLVAHAIVIFGFEYIVESEYWIRFTDWLGKDPTMTGRTTIWETSLDMVQKKWLFGHGRAERLIYLSTDEVWVAGYETHNMFLQVIFVTGVVGFACFLRYLFKSVNQLRMNNTIQRVLFIAIFICLANGLVEATNDNMFFRLLLALGYYSGLHIKEKEGDEISVGTNEEATA